jgi:hypothetical protein
MATATRRQYIERLVNKAEKTKPPPRLDQLKPGQAKDFLAQLASLSRQTKR